MEEGIGGRRVRGVQRVRRVEARDGGARGWEAAAGGGTRQGKGARLSGD